MSEQAGSGSNNRDYTTHPFSLDDAYARLSSEDFFPIMVCGSDRVKRLLSKEKELDLDDQLVAQLMQLAASFEDLVFSVRKLENTEEEVYVPENDPEMLRLVHLAKQILQDWEAIENVIPRHEQSSVSFSPMAPVDYPQIVPSAWLFEYHWRDDAHKEVLSIRKKYSHLLDQAYRDSFMSYLKKKDGVSGSIVLSHKKLLNFMASSREDFEYLRIKKCYKLMMSIKELCTKMNRPLDSLCASLSLTDQTKLLPNWRDDIYDQVVANRKMYSLELDKLLRDNTMQSATPDEAEKERESFLDEALQFLANSREGIAILREEYCREQLALIRHRLEDILPAKQSTTATLQLTNWRDLEYAALQNKTSRFVFEVRDLYRKHKAAWSQIPACSEGLKKLECHIESALKFYRMRRSDMSLLFLTVEDYRNWCRVVLKKDVDECIALIRLLLCCLAKHEGTIPYWDCCVRICGDILIPKLCKVAL